MNEKLTHEQRDWFRFARVPDIVAKLLIDERTPAGAIPIVAWQYRNQIIVEIEHIPESLALLHNCDWEGCGTLNHVVRFTVEDKYNAHTAKDEPKGISKEDRDKIHMLATQCMPAPRMDCVSFRLEKFVKGLEDITAEDDQQQAEPECIGSCGWCEICMDEQLVLEAEYQTEQYRRKGAK